MKATWSFDLEYNCLYQDGEHGEDETEDVLQRIGSKAVAGSQIEPELPTAPFVLVRGSDALLL